MVIPPWPMTMETPCPGPLQEFRASFFTSDALHAVHCLHSRRDDGGNGITKAIREVQVGAVDVGRSPGRLYIGSWPNEPGNLRTKKAKAWDDIFKNNIIFGKKVRCMNYNKLFSMFCFSSLSLSVSLSLSPLPHLHLFSCSWALYRFRDFLIFL